MKKVWISLYALGSLTWFVIFLGFITGTYYPKNSQIALALLFSSIYFLLIIYFEVFEKKG